MNKLFKITLEKTSKTYSEEYESNDGRGVRSEDRTIDSIFAYVSEVEFCPAWEKRYKATQIEVKEALYELQGKLAFLGVEYAKAKIEVEIPSKCEAQFVQKSHCRISMTREEYETLLAVTSTERCLVGRSFQEIPVAYFTMEYGIRGQYLRLTGKPGAARHSKKGYIEEFTDLSDDTEPATSSALAIAATLLEKLIGQTCEWDYRYMPSPASDTPTPTPASAETTLLGDLLKGVKF